VSGLPRASLQQVIRAARAVLETPIDFAALERRGVLQTGPYRATQQPAPRVRPLTFDALWRHNRHASIPQHEL